MSEPFFGEIKLFAGNFAPANWAFCDGQLLSISQNATLFHVLGTVYGGDGVSTFALPDMRGRAPMHPGTGPGLSPRSLGEKGGQPYVTLTIAEMPSHNHSLIAGSTNDSEEPQNRFPGARPIYADMANTVNMNASMVSMTGGNTGHINAHPFLGIPFIIALQGIFPS